MSDPEAKIDDDVGNGSYNKEVQGESSMDGPGKFIKKLFGKTSSSQTHTATVIPSNADEINAQQSTITEVQPNKSEKVANTYERSGDPEHSTVFTDTGAAMIGNSSNLPVNKQDDKATMDQVEMSLTVPSFVISPDENNSKPGLAILITNNKFAPGRGSFRSGAQNDLINMYEIFDHLNFEIRWEQFVNRTTADLLGELDICAQDSVLQQKQCLAIVISSHGAEVKLGRPYRPDHIPEDINVYGHAVATYDGMLPTTQIMDVFDDYNCSFLEGKPRLFFLQACRARDDIKMVDKGAEIQVTTQQSNRQVTNPLPGSSMDTNHEEETPETETKVINKVLTMKPMLLTPCYENYMVVFASTEAHIAWSEDYGGVLLTNMHKVFMDKINKKEDIDLLPTMSEVSSKMATDWESNFSDPRYHQSKSVMCLLHMLDQGIILKPV